MARTPWELPLQTAPRFVARCVITSCPAASAHVTFSVWRWLSKCRITCSRRLRRPRSSSRSLTHLPAPLVYLPPPSSFSSSSSSSSSSASASSPHAPYIRLRTPSLIPLHIASRCCRPVALADSSCDAAHERWSCRMLLEVRAPVCRSLTIRWRRRCGDDDFVECRSANDFSATRLTCCKWTMRGGALSQRVRL
jgi:hypothetical protein